MERRHEDYHEYERVDAVRPDGTHEVREEVHAVHTAPPAADEDTVVIERPVVPPPPVRVQEDVRVTETPTHRIMERIRTIATPEYRRRVRTVEDTSAPWRTVLARIIALIWLFAGAIITFIGLRLVLSLIGANPANTFAAIVYDVSDLFMWPFVGLAPAPPIGSGVLDIPAIIAMFAYPLATFLFVSLLQVLFSPSRRIISRQRYTTQQSDM